MTLSNTLCPSERDSASKQTHNHQHQHEASTQPPTPTQTHNHQHQHQHQHILNPQLPTPTRTLYPTPDPVTDTYIYIYILYIVPILYITVGSVPAWARSHSSTGAHSDRAPVTSTHTQGYMVVRCSAHGDGRPLFETELMVWEQGLRGCLRLRRMCLPHRGWNCAARERIARVGYTMRQPVYEWNG